MPKEKAKPDSGGLRIQAVAEQTGVPAATLRAWERRYGLPRPVRTDAAYRVYSDRDINDIRRLQKLCDAGLSIGEAVKTLKASEAQLQPSPQASGRAPVSPGYEGMVDNLLKSVKVLDLDSMAAQLAPLASTGPAADIYTHVLQPTMTRIGVLWRSGELSVGHEHLATEMVTALTRQLLHLGQPAYPRKTALLACFSEELHTMPLYGLGIRLLSWGCRSAVLGPRTPPTALAPAVRGLRPDVIGLSVTMAPPPARARELIEGYAEACGQTPWLVGGAAAADLAPLVRQFGGHAAPNDSVELNGLLETLLR